MPGKTAKMGSLPCGDAVSTAASTAEQAGLPCPDKSSLGSATSNAAAHGVAAAHSAASAGSKVAALLSAISWRIPFVILPYVIYLAYVRNEGLSQSDPYGSVPIATPLLGTAGYLLFVFLGKRAMANREPFQPTQWMIVYNLYQTLFNIWATVSFIQEVASLGGRVWGLHVDRSPSGSSLGFIIWAHYNNKYVEFFDTVFMVLRKKNQQVSFLHVYHHFLLVWAWYFVCRYACGGDAYFGALMNSIIHVIMYSYYLLALLKVACPWKAHVTMAQMVQFVVCATHAGYVYYLGDDYFPRPLAVLNIFIMSNMLALFGNFFYHRYIKKDGGKGKGGKGGKEAAKSQKVE